jgi:hypothetical protein
MKNRVDYDSFTIMEIVEAVRDGLMKLNGAQKVEAIAAACSNPQLTELAYELNLLEVNRSEDRAEEEVEEEEVDPDRQDRMEFLAFCRQATDNQLQHIYAKEKHHNRPQYAAIAQMAASERGIVINTTLKWTGEERPV